MTEMNAASREALQAARTTLQAELASTTDGSGAAQIGSDLFVVVDVLGAERSLRGLLSDPSAEPAERERLADTVFSGRIGEGASTVLRTAVRQQWSSARDLVDSVERLGREALLVSADQQGRLATVEDELFRLGRIVAGNPDLEIALTDRTAQADSKRGLISRLLYGKVSSVTESLASQAVGRLRGSPAAEFDTLSNMAAERRDQTVAHVRSAAAMTELQQQRLADSLSRLYDRRITVHVEVDPTLMSGVVVRVGDEVIDGSGAGRLAAVRKSIG